MTRVGKELRFRPRPGQRLLPRGDNWNDPVGYTVSLSGFNQGTNNVIYVTADDTHAAPDLDWIEVINTYSSAGAGASSTPGGVAPPAAGTCDRTKWIESSNVSSTNLNSATDGNLTTRWTSGRNSAYGDYFQIDFTGNVTISMTNSFAGYLGTVAIGHNSAFGATTNTITMAAANIRAVAGANPLFIPNNLTFNANANLSFVGAQDMTWNGNITT